MTAVGLDQNQIPDTRELRRRLEALVSVDNDRWTFRQTSPGDVAERLYQYPAMMVPRLQREILEVCTNWTGMSGTVYDPFLGSGTVLTEAMLQGHDFVGGDINPLAILISRVRAEAISAPAANDATRTVLDALSTRCPVQPHQFQGREKWFTPTVAQSLDRLRSAIQQHSSPSARRFMWVALAETVRLVSNSRTSTVKLHIRSDCSIRNRPDPAQLFAAVAERNAAILDGFRAELERRGHFRHGRYTGNVQLRVCDIREQTQLSVGMVVTSPPYGDSHSTIPYGQASFLQLHWINTEDIGPHAPGLLVSTREIDFRSLGGSLRNWKTCAHAMANRSEILAEAFATLRSAPADRTGRIAAFYSDLNDGLKAMFRRVTAGGLIVMTVGDRTVGGVKVPMAEVIRELVGNDGTTVTKLNRRIPLNRKRQASRNSFTSTMTSETVIVIQRSAFREVEK